MWEIILESDNFQKKWLRLLFFLNSPPPAETADWQLGATDDEETFTVTSTEYVPLLSAPNMNYSMIEPYEGCSH